MYLLNYTQDIGNFRKILFFDILRLFDSLTDMIFGHYTHNIIRFVIVGYAYIIYLQVPTHFKKKKKKKDEKIKSFDVSTWRENRSHNEKRRREKRSANKEQ